MAREARAVKEKVRDSVDIIATAAACADTAHKEGKGILSEGKESKERMDQDRREDWPP